MSTQRHPSEAVLADYVSGAQRPAFAAVTAMHLETCPACRDSARLLEEVGGEFLQTLSSAPLQPDSTERLLARLDAAEEPVGRPASSTAGMLSRIRFGRRRWVAPGLWVRPAEGDYAPDMLYLLRVPPGTTIFQHNHPGCEHIAVLEGDFNDSTGDYAPGDFAEIEPDLDHAPKAGEASGCLCLIASEHQMKMRTVFGRLFQLIARV